MRRARKRWGYERWEVVAGEDTTRARRGREISQQCASVASSQALVVEPDVRSGLGSRAANGHAETRLEGRNLLLGKVVTRQVELGVVYL